MKNLLLLSLILCCTLHVSSQASASNKLKATSSQIKLTAVNGQNFILLINGKQFHNGDRVEKGDFNTLCKNQLEILDGKTHKKYEPLSYHWVVSIRGANNKADLWKMECPANPAPNDYNPSYNMEKLMKTANAGDIIFIDEFKFAETDANLPANFSFVFK